MADNKAPIPAGIHVRYSENIAILQWNDGENRLNIDSIGRLNKVLDSIERNDAAKALVITGAGKYFSCGLDLKWLVTQDSPTIESFVSSFDDLVFRLLVFPIPIVAAINGHAYAGGAFLAMACDYRLMRSQRGWICFPEIDLKMSLHPPLAEVVRLKLRDNLVFRDMVLFGNRLTGEEAKAKGVADDCVDVATLMDASLAFIKRRLGNRGFDRTTMHRMKQDLYGSVVTSRKTRAEYRAEEGVSPRQIFERALSAKL